MGKRTQLVYKSDFEKKKTKSISIFKNALFIVYRKKMIKNHRKKIEIKEIII